MLYANITKQSMSYLDKGWNPTDKLLTCAVRYWLGYAVPAWEYQNKDNKKLDEKIFKNFFLSNFLFKWVYLLVGCDNRAHGLDH